MIAPLIFQRYMDTLHQDITGVICVQNDIALGDAHCKDHFNRLQSILQHLQNFRIQKEKINLMQPKI